MLPSFSNAFKVGRVFGIDIRMHSSFVLVMLAALIYSTGREGSLLGTFAYLVALFGIVLLHELGHSLVARRYGIRVLDITFWPLGGMARLEGMPENPKVELAIAIAGPAVNFALALLSAPIVIAALQLGSDAPVLEALFLPASIFCGLNLLMGVFNLAPAFPMDGGRVLRALLGLRVDWLSATRGAVAVGRAMAGVMLLVAFVLLFVWPLNAVMLAMVAVFVWLAGSAELWAVRARHGDVPGFAAAAARAAEYRPPAPASDAGHGSDPSGARRPTAWNQPSGRAPLSDRDVAALERFGGSLRPRADETS